MNQHLVYIMGRATAPAEELESKSGKKFTKFCVAVNEYHGPDKPEEAFFYDVLNFGKQPLAMSRKVKKGDVVMVQGRPRVEAYESKGGELRARLNVNSSFVSVFGKPTLSVSENSEQVAVT